jgi:hypothetical protein
MREFRKDEGLYSTEVSMVPKRGFVSEGQSAMAIFDATFCETGEYCSMEIISMIWILLRN